MPCMRAYQKIKILVKVCPTLFLLVTSVVHVDTVLINGRWQAKKLASSSIGQPTFPGNIGWWDRHSIATMPTFKS